jgi:hypothetical protein
MSLMKTIPNRKLTNNFSLYEFIEGAMPPEGVATNWKNIAQMNIAKIEEAANHAQTMRNLINREFKSDTGAAEIGLTITSGWRCKEWELKRGRSGNSQHLIAAYDAIPSNCSKEQAANIINWLFQRFRRNYNGGLAIKQPTLENGKIKLPGFIHFDFRGYVARWEY